MQEFECRVSNLKEARNPKKIIFYEVISEKLVFFIYISLLNINLQL